MRHLEQRRIDRSVRRAYGSHSHRQRRPSWLHRLTVTWLVTSLAYLSPASMPRVHAQSSGDDVATTMARLDQLDAVLSAVRSGLDRTRYDASALALELAFEDPHAIAEHLRKTLAFEPYSGILRGATGTLRSGGGNAHDQALLLTTLLRDVGFDARIVLGRLTVEEAERLVAGAFERPQVAGIEATPAWEELAALAAIAPGGDAAFAELTASTDPSWVGSWNLVDLERMRAIETTLVAAVGIERLGGADALAEVIEQVRDYAWVEYQEIATGAWTALHPAWRTGEPPGNLVVEEILLESVPEHLQHRVRFQAFIERKVGDALEVHPLMAPWERPVANAADRAYSFAAIPIRSADYAAAVSNPVDVEPIVVNLEGALAASDFFVPLFNGAPAEGAMAFDLEGNVAPLDAAANPAAGVFRNVANATNRAATALGGLGGGDDTRDDPAMALTALYYETTLVEPGGVERTERRYLFDRIGVANRESDVFDLDERFQPHDVPTTVTWSVHGGRVHEGWYLELVLDRLLAARPVVERVIADVIGDELTAANEVGALLSKLEDDGGSVATLEHLELALRFDKAPEVERDVVAFRPSATLIAVERGFSEIEGVDGSVVRLSTDIQANSRRVLRRDAEGAVEIAALEAMRYGIWETAMERAFTMSAASVGALMKVESAFDAFDGSEGTPILVETAEGVARLADSFSAGSTAAMLRDIDRGFVLVVPSGREGSVESWWRVDRLTGESLGIANDGRGQSLVEYLVAKGFSLLVAKAAAFIVYGVTLYAFCVLGAGAVRHQLGMPLPLRQCAVPLVGLGVALGLAPTAAAATTASAAAAAGYIIVMYVNMNLDMMGL